uniref:RWD domain-containing protein 3 n=2 Tax=Pipistrellus kuhlii TaxID=59472 RepID=A0A7J7TWK0_PIPKU|nr:RWD domain containing 3 [Pipistrellus kuhlii]
MAEQEERAEEERAAAEEERAAAEEERAALAAIFCGPGEWEVLGRSETRGSVCRVRTTAEGPSGPDTPLELVFHLPAGYPACPPGVSVGSERLTRAQCAALRDQLLEQARAFPPEPMVHQLVLWAQQNLRHLLAPPGSGAGPGGCATAGPGEAEAPWTALVRLDHMRAKASYTRTLRHWASALGLAGRLLFAGRVILLLLQGPRDRVKEFLVLQRTSKVDVDSSGRKCRERMASVLWEAWAQPGHARFLAFEVKEFSSLDELQKEFEAAGLLALFSELALGLVK